MDFARLQKNWTNLGRRDPLWAILSDPTARGGKWDLDAFLQTGVDFGRYLVRHLRGLQEHVLLDRALDFGCGYGRLSQALAWYFQEVVGVDIAPTMIEGAREIDRTDGRCRFVLNAAASLAQFEDESFDLVLTILVLQHMRPEYSMSYVREFLRILRPGGLAFFQLPTEPAAPAVERMLLTQSPATEPLAKAPLRALVSVHPGHLALQVSQWHYVRVHVQNVGDRVWRTGRGPAKVQLAWRWHNLEGTPGAPAVCVDLPHDVRPGDSARVLVPVRAPGDALTAVLQWTVVQGGTWIESSATSVARMIVQIVGDPSRVAMSSDEPPPPPPVPGTAGGSGHEDEAEIEVHGVPVHEVIEVVRQAGGKVLDVAEDVWAGPDWLSAHYTIRKV